MSKSLVGLSTKVEGLKEAVDFAKSAGFLDWNENELSQSIYDAIKKEPFWGFIVIDDEGDLLLGKGAEVVVTSLESWKIEVQSLAAKIL